MSTTSYAELHDFADRAGISRRAFEGDHYDIPEERYADVVTAGAVPIDGRELLKRLRDSGLRISKRKHERVVMSTPGAPWLPPGSRADVIASRQDSPPPNTVVVRAVVRSAGAMLVVERADGRGLDLPTRTVGDGEIAQDALWALGNDLGVLAEGATLLGYVRNVVAHPDSTYPWPTPTACFALFEFTAPGLADVAGTWLPSASLAAELGDRHWWALIDPGARAAGHVHP